MIFRNTVLLRRISKLRKKKQKTGLEIPTDGATILVVEADPSELERISDVLEEWHYQVLTARDGEQALPLVKKDRPSLVLTSLELPGFSGVQLCQKIREEKQTAHIPCVCMAFAEEIQNWEIQAGLFTGEYIQKPVSFRRLRTEIDAALKESSQTLTGGTAVEVAKKDQIDQYIEEFQRQTRAQDMVSTQGSVEEGIDDILEEFGFQPSQDPRAPGKGSPEERNPRELDVERFELQKMLTEESVPESETTTLYEKSRVFVLESIRRADSGKAPVIGEGENLVEDMMSSVDTNLELLLAATERTQEFALSTHCVNVAIFALTMAKTLGCDVEQRLRVGLAALLHEIGVVKLPKKLIYKQEELSEAEVEELRQRPVHGAQILQTLGSQYSWLPEIVGQVYEREDETGFPLGLTGKSIREEAKLIGLADVFEACIHERPYREAMTGYEAVRELTSKGAKLFSNRVVKALLTSFSLYPYNEYVVLNSREIGKVVEVNNRNLFRPVVKIFYNKEGDRLEEPRLVDLALNVSLFIKEAITADALPQSCSE
ncbi:response regulator [Acidobacteria bacterium AH-259-D05]|nr:response regulator [Acidobacteria bacterium AH-259-D05]